MDYKNDTVAAPKRLYTEASDNSDDNSDDQSITQQFKKQKQKKSKKQKKQKQPKAEETDDELNLSVEIVQVGPCPRDFHEGPEHAIETLRTGNKTVAAFLLRNDDLPDQNGSVTPSVEFHQSTRHHLTPDALSRLEKMGEKVASNMEQGEYTKKKDLKGLPGVTMDNTYGSEETHRFHQKLADIYERLYENFHVHIDRRWYRNQRMPTKKELNETPFSDHNFHREGHCHKETGLGSLAFICVTGGHRSVVTLSGPQPGGTVAWEKPKAGDVDPATHKIVLWDFHVPEGFHVIILLQQNCWHGVAPYGQSTGCYAGFQTTAEFEGIKAKFAEMQQKGTFLDQHVPFLREPSQSTGQMFTWEEVVAICIVMGAPFPLYGSCKPNVMDGVDKSGRNFAGPMSHFKQKPRLDSKGEPCIGPDGQPKRMLCNPSFRPDGTVAHTDPDYRRQVEELGIRIHDDCWAEEFPLWVHCPLQMHNTYGADYLMRIGLIPRNSTL